MAKMFYSIEEAAKRLNKSEDDVRKMAASGQLQEFKDREKLMFKREQVDLLAGDATGNEDVIPLADSHASKAGSSLTLALDDEPEVPAASSRSGGKGGSGSSMGIEADEPGHRSGISIFDADAPDQSDPLAATAITPTGRRGAPAADEGAGELTAMESGGSGSGLLDLTREADDTSLGADLLEDVYKKDDEDPLAGSGVAETQGASGLFETTSAPSDMSASAAAPAMAMIAAEPYDGTWSGIAGGIALGVVIACVATMFALMSGMLDAAGNSGIVAAMTGNIWYVVGGFGAFMLIGGIVGLFVGKRT